LAADEEPTADLAAENEDERKKFEVRPKNFVSAPDEEKTDDAAKSEETAEKLTALTDYLRLQHRYCVWCGTQFESDEDLQLNCPGPNAEAHE